MQIRWRMHEMLFVTILTISQILLSLSTHYNSSSEKPGYYTSISALLVYVVYILISQLIAPSVRNFVASWNKKFAWLKAVWVIWQIVLVSYLFSIGVSVLTYFAKPYLVNYAGYPMLALLGYNDRPMENLFFGFGRATILVAIITIILSARELIIQHLNKPHPRRAFRVLVANNLTLALCIALLVPIAINPAHSRFMDYLAWTIPALILYFYTTFWLFPSNDGFRWTRTPFLTKLVLATLAGAVFSAIVFSGSHHLLQFFISWAVFLLIATPLYWLLYLQRKDRIIQLKGLETALANSDTALQFLRSQINPHFLFNSFNALYGIALKEHSRKTAEGIQILGDMMRFMLHDNAQDSIPMNREIDYLKNYIYLQKLRIPETTNILIEDNINVELCGNETIAPMLLIPFVENAFKHGINPDEKSWIVITLECNIQLIHFEVRNSVHSEPAYTRKEGEPDGIGLKNVYERLKLLYPNKHELKTSTSGNEFIATLKIYKTVQ